MGRKSRKYDLIVGKVNEILNEYASRMTLRQIYYRLVAGQVIENKLSAYTSLSAMLVKARKRGDVDYRRIEDRVRRVDGGDGYFSDPHAYIRTIIRRMRRDAENYELNRTMWTTQPKYVEVWVEKDALSGVIYDAIRDYKLPLAVARGYSSFSFLMDAVERFGEHQDKTLKILYFGDFDPSGEDMVRDLRERLCGYAGFDIEIRKVALTPSLIQHYDLPPAPAKRSDTRSSGFVAEHGINSCVELDALPPDVLQDIVRSAVRREIDVNTWNETKRQAEQEAEQVMRLYADIESAIQSMDDESDDE